MESDRLDRKLQEMAKTEVLIPQEEMQLLDRECTSNWHTQGMGAARYAISSLESSMQPLLDYGFTAEIRTLNTENRTDAYNHYYYYAEYELWANAESWQLDVCRRRMSVLEWATACWRSGTNPKVYNPWLDDETFERSMSIAMTGGK